jgi:uncharacterized protein (TIGR02391 family)
MPAPHHDNTFLTKLAKRTKKSPQSLRELASRKAGQLGISSPAALLLWARERGVSITRALNKLPKEAREEVRGAMVPPKLSGNRTTQDVGARRARKQAPAITPAGIDSLLQDAQLRGRCRDLLLANEHFDRAFREATTVLDDRLKKKSGIKNLNPLNLVNKAVNPDPQKAVIEVSAEKDQQEGFHGICKGVMLAFRNKSHHELSDKFTREDALKFCGFIDAILGLVEQANLHPERV